MSAITIGGWPTPISGLDSQPAFDKLDFYQNYLWGSLIMLESDREAFRQAHLAWEAGDIDAFMAYLHEDIIYLVNVDGLQVPYPMSSLGKNDAFERLSFLIHTFVVERFVLEKMVHETDHSCSVVHGIYRHRKTGEVLETKLRFKGWVTDGKITRLEETLDANYIQAFERFVFYQQQAAQTER